MLYVSFHGIVFHLGLEKCYSIVCLDIQFNRLNKVLLYLRRYLCDQLYVYMCALNPWPLLVGLAAKRLIYMYNMFQLVNRFMLECLLKRISRIVV